eukprot:TRINITY_DN2357_c1_g1_i1.p1 TRINITY_DN2357_c1_g1~~TRINITY_DN2357_c1_g1_i1.p1  ORF type:complete len:94 (+),score=16.39 TRINITY_DN2357_c1_g1_i1:802-1083(+)
MHETANIKPNPKETFAPFFNFLDYDIKLFQELNDICSLTESPLFNFTTDLTFENADLFKEAEEWRMIQNSGNINDTKFRNFVKPFTFLRSKNN